MKTTKLLTTTMIGLLLFSATSCQNEPSAACVQMKKADEQLAANLAMYEATWDKIVNNGDLDLINETNFDKDITLITSPENIVGIEAFKAYYKNYIVGFSNVTFTIVDVFGHGDKIAKHWNFKGTHSGDFFGIPATGNDVNIDGVTLVKMKDGKIAREQDFLDNLAFFQQLGLIPNE
jgi:steroid delta-isomerase-like uncharacterized protein